MRLTERRR